MEGVFAPIYAEQHFDAGIIVLSYVVSVIGAQTTLELLGRRTSIKGSYNLFLLCGAALAMGSVGIWSMHFIGNNSLKLQYHNMTYQLVYAPGFTFASLIVAIVCMFCSFAFVCSTAEVLLKRVFLSGMIAGVSFIWGPEICTAIIVFRFF
jgi:NO-binding membrane sensor protein with MHYT domain